MHDRLPLSHARLADPQQALRVATLVARRGAHHGRRRIARPPSARLADEASPGSRPRLHGREGSEKGPSRIREGSETGPSQLCRRRLVRSLASPSPKEVRGRRHGLAPQRRHDRAAVKRAVPRQRCARHLQPTRWNTPASGRGDGVLRSAFGAPREYNGEVDSEYSGVQRGTVEYVSFECWLGDRNTYSASRISSRVGSTSQNAHGTSETAPGGVTQRTTEGERTPPS